MSCPICGSIGSCMHSPLEKLVAQKDQVIIDTLKNNTEALKTIATVLKDMDVRLQRLEGKYL